MAPLDSSLDKEFTWSEVRESILRQADKKSMKPFDIPVEVWKSLADTELVDRLQELYNVCLTESVVPDDFNLEHVFGLFKKGNTTDNNNYRWLGMIDALCKILASMIVHRVMALSLIHI